MDSTVLLQCMQLLMSTVQTCFLAYLAARYRTPWDIPINAPKRPRKAARNEEGT